MTFAADSALILNSALSLRKRLGVMEHIDGKRQQESQPRAAVARKTAVKRAGHLRTDRPPRGHRTDRTRSRTCCAPDRRHPSLAKDLHLGRNPFKMR